jgi:phenylacetate-coenzyme A ligase PaaK-like adenylate-forming protein
MGLLARLGGVTEVAPKDLFLAVPPMAPRVTNALPYLWIYTDMLETKLGLEFVVGSLYMLGRNNWPEFALRKQPTALLCRPAEALSLVDNFASAANRPGARPSELFRRLRRGIFFGEPLAPLRSRLEEAYGLEAFDCYLSAEFAGLFAECRAHDGLHLWLDVCIAEVIPDQGPDLEHKGVRAVPDAAFLEQAAPGLVGELVVTTFGESLPLVRYRTGDRIEVVSTAPCACGRTHPRVRCLGRVTP